ATGVSMMEVSRQMGKSRGTIQGWLRPGGVADRMGLKPNVETVIEQVPPATIKVRVKANSGPEGAVTKILAVGDSHDDPETPKDRFRAMGRLACDRGVDWVVQIGDFASFDSLSSHIPNDSIAGKLKNPFSRDMPSLNDAMGAFDIGCNGHKCNRHVTLGNHERRVWLYKELRPEIAGMMT